jgi:hypothetical protein
LPFRHDTHAQTGSPIPQKSQSASAPALQVPPWTGDIDGMLERRYIRALVTYSKSQYYIVNDAQHGSAYEYLKAFEQ